MSEALAEALRRWQSYGCPDCSGDCGSANPPVSMCIMQDTRAALAAYDAAPAPSDAYAAGMRQAADLCDQHFYTNAADLIRDLAPAAIPAAGAWEPPPEADRPWGLQCLGWIDDEWNHIIWTGDAWRWVSEGGEIVTPTAFAPLPSAPAGEGEAT